MTEGRTRRRSQSVGKGDRLWLTFVFDQGTIMKTEIGHADRGS